LRPIQGRIAVSTGIKALNHDLPRRILGHPAAIRPEHQPQAYQSHHHADRHQHADRCLGRHSPGKPPDESAPSGPNATTQTPCIAPTHSATPPPCATRVPSTTPTPSGAWASSARALLTTPSLVAAETPSHRDIRP
jgi:hypothetical protein